MAKSILIHLDGGIGDIIMGTPMVNALVKAGHTVDVCIGGDRYPAIGLFKNWPGPRLVSAEAKDFVTQDYDFYLLGSWVRKALTLKNREKVVLVNAEYRKMYIDYGLSQADLMLQYARAVDPGLDLNAPAYCGHSGRVFPEITKQTVVLFPGCKKEYPMKRWDKFEQLANQFDDVAVIGTYDDLFLENSVVLPSWVTPLDGFLSYNGRAAKLIRLLGKKYNQNQHYAPHVKNYIGQLSLEDAAALVSQAGLLIGNDGGLAHVAAAMKIPTYVLSGPTDPLYWQIKGGAAVSISKNLPCQPCFQGCGRHTKAWKYNYIGCPIDMKCMRELTVEDVMNIVKPKVLS